MTIAELVKRIYTGDTDALGELYKMYREKFIRTLIKQFCCDVGVATEIYQDCILLVYEKIIEGNFKNPENVNSLWNYLYTVGQNKFKERTRAEGKTDLVDFSNRENDVKADNSLEEQSLQEKKENRIQEVTKALNELGEPCTRLLELFYYEKRSMEEIKKIMGYSSTDTVKTAKYKCVQRIKKKISPTKKTKQ